MLESMHASLDVSRLVCQSGSSSSFATIASASRFPTITCMPSTSIGDRVRALRKAAKLTQEELARQIGVVSMSISRIERDVHKPDDDTLPALAKYFDVSPAFIEFGVQETKVTYDRDEEIDRAADAAGLEGDLRTRLYDACRSIGPMSAGELLSTAERIARNAKTDGLTHRKNTDRAQAEPSRVRSGTKGFR
jgi:transcriptional regulator with XRE-family HTH domain